MDEDALVLEVVGAALGVRARVRRDEAVLQQVLAEGNRACLEPETQRCALSAGARIYFGQLFGACRRRTPRAREDPKFTIGKDPECTMGKASTRCTCRHLQIGAGPRRSPSACSEMLLN